MPTAPATPAPAPDGILGERLALSAARPLAGFLGSAAKPTAFGSLRRVAAVMRPVRRDASAGCAALNSPRIRVSAAAGRNFVAQCPLLDRSPAGGHLIVDSPIVRRFRAGCRIPGHGTRT